MCLYIIYTIQTYNKNFRKMSDTLGLLKKKIRINKRNCVFEVFCSMIINNFKYNFLTQV